MESNYWQKRFSRRRALRYGAVTGLGIGAASLIACGDDSTSTPAPTSSATSSPTGTATASPTGSATGSATASPTNVATDKTLTFGIDQDPNSQNLNPYYSSGGQAHWMDVNFFDNLWNHNQASETYPGLATAMEIADDGLSAVLTLREGVKFHDGSDLTAEDVKFSLDQSIDKIAATYGTLNNVTKAEITDPTHIKLTLSAPNAVLQQDLAGQWAAIVQKKAYEAAGKDNFTGILMGTGPFKYLGTTAGVGLKMERFEDYWGLKSSAKAIDVQFAVEPATRLGLLESGTADIVASVPLSEAKRIDDADEYTVTHITSATIYAPFRLEPGLEANEFVKDVRFRQALSYAIDYQSIIDNVYFGFSEQIGSQCVPSAASLYGCAKTNMAYEYKPDETKKLLEAAGYTNESIRILWGQDDVIPEGRAAGQAVLQMLTDAGVTVDMPFWDAGQFFSTIGQGHISNDEKLTANLTYWTVATSYDYGPIIAGSFASTGGGYGYYADAGMDKKIADLTANLDPTSRQAAMEDIMVELHDKALALWLWGYPLLHAVNNRVNFKLQGIERNTRFNEVTFNS